MTDDVYMMVLDVSIHAPVKVRHPYFVGFRIYPKKVSIHAPVKVRHIVMLSKKITRGFNPRTREGATW